MLSVTLKYLRKEEAPEMGVLGQGVGDAHGDDVGEPLDLVDDGIRVGHPCPVSNGGEAFGANDLCDLLLHLGCRQGWVGRGARPPPGCFEG